jgi:isopenicillin N synthase-like dioxygenase
VVPPAQRILTAGSATALPTIDIDDPDPAAFARAAAETGAFVLTGTRIDTGLVERMLALSHRFFALQPEELATIAMERSPQFRGYSCVGTEQTQGRADQREQLDVGPESAAVDTHPDDPPYRRLDGPNQWPAALPALRPAVMAWMEHGAALSERVFEALLAGLDAPPGSFDGAFAPDPHLRIKVVRYPGIPPSDDAQGVGAHRDSGLLTLIAQDPGPGLQVFLGDRYVDVVTPPGALVAVLGRALERATHGCTTAAQHRVVSPPPGRDRISVPFFFNPRLDYAIEPIDLPAYVRARGHTIELDTADVRTRRYGETFLNVLLRSHRPVAARHHPDLLADQPR